MSQSSSKPLSRLPILALCASGGSPAGLASFLSKLAPSSIAAEVILFQHREALDTGAFQVSASSSGRDLVVIKDGMTIEAGKTYLAEIDQILTLEGNRFLVRRASESAGERGTLDSFLVALGNDEKIYPIAVLFAGTGSDGTLGVATVKEGGGLTLAEDDGEAGPLGSATSPAAIADFQLPPTQLADRVSAHLKHLLEIGDDQFKDVSSTNSTAILRTIATVLRNQTGHDFHGYKRGTFLRRVQRRMQVLEIDALDAYVARLQAEPDEALHLFNDLLIGVTKFFRDYKEYDLLEAQVIPKLFEGKGRSQAVRVWVIGCSTGEEAYSLAILLREHISGLDEVPQIQIFATDIDGRALASARAGRYPDTIAKDLSPQRLGRWFVKEGNTYVIAKELREMCIFSQHSVIKDAPFSRIDLVSCRNLLIYLDTDLQSRVIPLFHFALNKSGFLFLGNSENVSRHTNLFSPVESRFRVFRRLETGSRTIPEFPLTSIDRRPVVRSDPAQTRLVEPGLARSAERIADRYAPAYVIVDENLSVLHFSGRMGRYIDPAGGAASLSLLNLVHSDLRLDLRAALTRAGETGQAVQAENLWIGQNGHRTMVDLVVEPVHDDGRSPRSFVVIFKDGATVPDSGADGSAAPSLLRDELVQRLETELRTTKDRLQTTVEEYESTNEELKSANEEYQSLNEELQSANEELETSKEELQSVNEELTTVNGELSHRVQELGRTNSDLKNLLESTQIATVFLDNDLRVTNYTPAVTEIYPLVESDIGRPIGHIRSGVTYDDLQDDARRVIRTLGTVDREVTNPATGTRYIARMLPYRSVDNFIGGAVVTFTDVTPLTTAQLALRDSEERFRAVANLVPDLLWSADAEGNPNWFNRRWLDFTGQKLEEAISDAGVSVVHPDDRQMTAEIQRNSIASGEAFTLQHRMRQADGAYRWFLVRAEPVRDGNGRITQWFGASTDVEEQRRALETVQISENQAKLLLAELQHRVRNTLAVVRSIVRRTGETSESVEDYVSHLEGRLAAFSRVQSMVTRDPSEGVSLDQLVADELGSVHAREGEQLKIEGSPLRLSPKAAEVLGLAVHELATNAMKYGALSEPGGTISIKWEEEEDGDTGPMLRFVWEETASFEIEVPARKGFGTELIERQLAYELHARSELVFNARGVTCSVTIPLSSVVISS